MSARIHTAKKRGKARVLAYLGAGDGLAVYISHHFGMCSDKDELIDEILPPKIYAFNIFMHIHIPW